MPATVRELADDFHDRWLATNPFGASLYGIPGYDGEVPDDSETGEAAWRAELESVLVQAQGLDEAELSEADAITLDCLVANIGQELRDLDARLIEHTVTAMPFSGPAVLLSTAARTLIPDGRAAADYLERLSRSGGPIVQPTASPTISA